MYEIYGYPYGNPDAELLIYQPGNVRGTVFGPKLTREVSKGGSLIFTMPREHPQYEMLQKMSTVVQVRQDGKETWRGRIFSHEADWYNNRAVYCEGALSFFNDSCVTPFNYEGTLKQFLRHLIDVHNAQVAQKMKMFELGTVTAALGDVVVHFGDADKYGVGEDYGKIWDILDKMVLKVFGGYFYCTFNADTGYNVLNYCDQAVEEKRMSAQKIEYGVNLLNLTEKTDTNNLYTRIYPVGNKHTVKKTAWYYKLMWWKDHSHDYDEDHEERWGIMETDTATIKKYLPAGYTYNLTEGYIEHTEAVKKFGVIARIVEFDTDSANDTFAAGVQALQQNHTMVTSYVINAVDLVDAGEATDRLTFACYAHILSVPHSVDAVMLCSKLVEPLDHPEKKEFTFGMTRRTLTDRHVEYLGKTNLLDESSSAAEKYAQNLLDQLFAYKRETNAKLGDISNNLTSAIKRMGDLQDQIDDNITSWFYEGKPTTTNKPASSWTTETVKRQHIGDLYYDKKTGLGYRWVIDTETGVYSWTLIRDTGVAKALADAAAAQSAADSKVRCFVTTPTPPYDRGDIWMQGDGGDIMRCQTDRGSGSYNAGDWVRASKYTDDTAANAAQNTANQAKKDAAEAAKTATNFLEFNQTDGLIVRHESLPGKRVQISNDGVKVLNGSSMVNIKSDSISITDGNGSCSINSGAITFHGIRNTKIVDITDGNTQSYGGVWFGWDLSNYASIVLTYESYTDDSWWSHDGATGYVSTVLPVNGETFTIAMPWNTPHFRTVTVHKNGIQFGGGVQRASKYELGIGSSFKLEKPWTAGWIANDSVCVPKAIYGLM